MKEFKILETASGEKRVRLEYRKVDPVTKIRNYKSKVIILDSKISPDKTKEFLTNEYLKFEKEMDEHFKVGSHSGNYTVSEFVDMYLEYLKTNFSLNHYSRSKDVSTFVKSELGKIKLTDLTPIHIQNFYNKVATITKTVVSVKPKPMFNQILEENGLTPHILRYDFKVQHATLQKVMNGGNTTEKWSNDFCRKTGLLYNDLFIKETMVSEIAFNTKKKYIAFLKSCLAEAKRKRLVIENYATSDFVRMVRNNTPNKKTKCMSKKEYTKFYKFVKDYPSIKMSTAIFLILNTGMRKEELMGLKWKNIDFENRLITIENTVVYVSGFGVVESDGKTKNMSSNRTIPVGKLVLEKLESYKTYFEEVMEWRRLPYNEDSKLFLQENGSVMNPNTVNYWLSKMLEECGLENYSVHSLRHSYASVMLEIAPVLNVSKRVGHSRASTTTDIYGHIITESDKIYAETDKFLLEDEKTPNELELLKALELLHNKGVLNESEYNDYQKRIKFVIFQKVIL